MKNISFLDKYRYYIGGFLILVIIAGWVYLFLAKNETSSYDNSEEITLLKNRINELEKNIETVDTDMGEVAGTKDDQNIENNIDEKININTAAADELETISGIGPARAQDIIEYRDTNGGFATTSEIQNIKGIGPATYEKMKDQITIE